MLHISGNSGAALPALSAYPSLVEFFVVEIHSMTRKRLFFSLDLCLDLLMLVTEKVCSQT